MARASDTAAQRTHILTHASRTLAERGYDGTRLKDVARAAGVSIGLVQHYFDTRDQLLTEAFGWSIDQLLDRWRAEATSHGDEWRRLRALIDTLVDDANVGQRSATWVEFCISAARREPLREGVARAYRAWRELLRGLVAEGTTHGAFAPSLPPDQAADVLSTLVDGCDLAMSTGAGVMTADEYRDILLAACTALLRPTAAG